MQKLSIGAFERWIFTECKSYDVICCQPLKNAEERYSYKLNELYVLSTILGNNGLNSADVPLSNKQTKQTLRVYSKQQQQQQVKVELRILIFILFWGRGFL